MLGSNIHLVRIGRIDRRSSEEYGVLHEDIWYPQDVNRSDIGIESFFATDFDPDLSTGVNLAEEEFRWLPPIARPGKILCIGRNYAEHSREQGKEPESEPLIFSKFSSCMTGHQSQVEYPPHTDNLDYEVELAVIIGKEVKSLQTTDDVWDKIFGYTLANDLTARDVQKSEKQWTRGKGFDQSLPIGPLIQTADAISPPIANNIWLKVNGELRQSSKTDHMIFSIPYLIRYISQVITLQPGDILLTGTPEGVGYYMEPKGVLHSGDIVESGIDGIGNLTFTIT